tara:strand:- start:332 stop:574 length:243 start_codon:yes stop_codon:yes gene_type:complete
MSYFWPRRSTPKGFSIEGLANQYREKLTKGSVEELKSRKNCNQFDFKDSSCKNTNAISKEPKVEFVHWANRDFIEYKEAA